jgi:hypothetical protein
VQIETVQSKRIAVMDLRRETIETEGQKPLLEE